MLGENIRRQRVLRALKQTYVAAKAGLSQSGYSRIERGESDPSFSTVQKIARAIGCSMHDLVEEPGHEPAPEDLDPGPEASAAEQE